MRFWGGVRAIKPGCPVIPNCSTSTLSRKRLTISSKTLATLRSSRFAISFSLAARRKLIEEAERQRVQSVGEVYLGDLSEDQSE